MEAIFQRPQKVLRSEKEGRALGLFLTESVTLVTMQCTHGPQNYEKETEYDLEQKNKRSVRNM